MAPTARLLILLSTLASCEWSPTDPDDESGNTQVDAVYITDPHRRVIVGEAFRLVAQATRRRCDIEYCWEEDVPASFTWRSSDTTVATVHGGAVRALRQGTARIHAKAGAGQGTATIEVGRVRVSYQSVGDGGACGLVEAGALYCWGPIALAPDPPNGPLDPNPMLAHLAFTQTASSWTQACAITTTRVTWCWYRTVPDLFHRERSDLGSVPGNHEFGSITVGGGANAHACGLDGQGIAWCWGANSQGQLGAETPGRTCPQAGNSTCSVEPVRVQGNLAFNQISAGTAHTCGVSGGSVYCWGANNGGMPGTSEPGRVDFRPVLETSDAAMVAAGNEHTCVLLRDGAVWCWGSNTMGQLGTGTTDPDPHAEPARISGIPALVSIDADGMTCGLTAEGDVYCWGGSMVMPRRPALVPLAKRSTSLGIGRQLNGSWWIEQACVVGDDGSGTCWRNDYETKELNRPVEWP